MNHFATANPAIPATPYDKLGGAPALHRLTQRFYELMDELPEAWGIRQIHPESLAGSQQSLFEFLSGWLGGPQLFTEKRSQPRLRMRHSPYTIDHSARDQWMLCMRMALAEQVTDNRFREALVMAFDQMADHFVNNAGAQGCSHAHSHAPLPATA